MELLTYMRELAKSVKAASASFARSSTAKKNEVLSAMADMLWEAREEIYKANELDLSLASENGVPAPMLDRLKLDEKRVAGICDAIRALIALPDPIGKGSVITRPNGLTIKCTKVPLGVVAMIYEARPNVTVDAAAMCVKAGNSVVLRGGKEAINTNKALVKIMKKALESVGVSPDVIGLVENTERESANILMTLREYIDVLIPRGGKGLIKNVCENAKIPVIETGAGNCHLYVDDSAELSMALEVAMNAKTSRPSVCNAIETLLVHESVAEKFLPMFKEAGKAFSLDIRGCERTRAIIECNAATDEDFATEYDDYIISVKVVSSLDEAIEHINEYSTHHSEAIITKSLENAERFQAEIDSAAVYVNASTRFTDGGEFGFGAEIGISTQKLHARGPMGLDVLSCDKYLINGKGQIR